MQKYGLLLFQIYDWTRTSQSLLRDEIICDSSEGKCRVWTAGTELRSVVVSEMLYVRVTEMQREMDWALLIHEESIFQNRYEAKKPSHV